MARKCRFDEIGYYHVINRGVEKRDIFLESADFETFLSIIDEAKGIYCFNLYAYCLMNNHYHLLIETTSANLSVIMKQINAKYSIYFNKKYHRIGPLWQGRFKSWYVHDDHYLELLTKYIENNPIKAQMVMHVGEYPWSSHLSQETTIDTKDLDKLAEYQKMKIEASNHSVVSSVKKPIEDYFQNSPRNDAIMQAVQDGYPQNVIAEYTQLSTVAISKIIKNQRQKENLFDKLKVKGIFWSYVKSVLLRDVGDEIFIEHTLKYADFDEIVELFTLYGKKRILSIWERELKNDLRFKKLNLFLARVFFGMDIEADYFKGGINEREKKLRLLAS
jgi:putative transposase